MSKYYFDKSKLSMIIQFDSRKEMNNFLSEFADKIENNYFIGK